MADSAFNSEHCHSQLCYKVEKVKFSFSNMAYWKSRTRDMGPGTPSETRTWDLNMTKWDLGTLMWDVNQ